MIKKNILWLKEINKKQISDVGGKGANLGELINNNFPIPNGFVITSYAYTQNAIENNILTKIENIEKSIDANNILELNKKSKQIKNIILKTKISKQLEKDVLKAYKKLGNNLVAIRSSATAEDLPNASFAGQQDTFLNVLGKENLLKYVKKCWASLFNPRAIFYRQKQGFSIENVKLAVVIQKQISSKVSGIMFTQNPITNNPKEIVIEIVYGLGESIVSGSLTPDTIIIDKKTMKIKSKNIAKQDWKIVRNINGTTKKERVPKNLSEKQKLSDKLTLEFAKLGYNIEKHYKKPQDIEFAIEKNKLYILQSRPITTINKTKK